MLSQRRKPDDAKGATTPHKAVTGHNSAVPAHKVTLHVTLELLAGAAAQQATPQLPDEANGTSIPGEPPIVYPRRVHTPTERTAHLYGALEPLLRVVMASCQCDDFVNAINPTDNIP